MALLPVIGATLGGIEGYRRSGGNIGSALIGAGLGAVAPAGLRYAGTALGANLAGTGVKQGLATALGAGAKAARGAGLTGVARPLSKGAAQVLGMNPVKAAAGLGSLAAGGGMLVAPSIAGNVGAGLASVGRAITDPLGRAGQTAAGIVGYTRAGEPVYSTPGGAVPNVGQFGGIDPYGAPLDIYGPDGMARRGETVKTAEAQRDAMRLLLPEIFQASEGRSKAEFERQMAAAGIRQNIATRAQMLQAAQQAGLNLGLTAAQQAGAALTSQYQYQ